MAEGLKSTSASRPSEWLMAALCFALVALFLWYLRSREAKDDERQEKHNAALAAVVEGCNVAQANGRTECHGYTLQLQARTESKIGELHDATGKLHATAESLAGTCGELRGAVHDLRALREREDGRA